MTLFLLCCCSPWTSRGSGKDPFKHINDRSTQFRRVPRCRAAAAPFLGAKPTAPGAKVVMPMPRLIAPCLPSKEPKVFREATKNLGRAGVSESRPRGPLRDESAEPGRFAAAQLNFVDVMQSKKLYLALFEAAPWCVPAPASLQADFHFLGTSAFVSPFGKLCEGLARTVRRAP